MSDRRMSRNELIQHLAIRMAAANRNPPILRGKASPRDVWERDRFRRNFAEWFVEECIESAGLAVIDTKEPTTGSHMAGFDIARRHATPPQRYAQ